ncbi:hypothetical protein QAD02_003093 [Eretmocerus hayati]|uniref:Uncharacterized protein n=1 Tax=Eretmocerus hayati TaxID=131215 RepID=A0ACC2NL54_9HYME|nr:hypothetical protein QAD02_003093 [Eretmocerus hayati]
MKSDNNQGDGKGSKDPEKNEKTLEKLSGRNLELVDLEIRMMQKHLGLSIQIDKTTFRSKVAYNSSKEAIQLAHRNENEIQYLATDLDELFDRLRDLEYQMRGIRFQNRQLKEQLRKSGSATPRRNQP